MNDKPKSRLEIIAMEADKHAKAKKAGASPQDPSHPALCPACHQPMPQDAGGPPSAGPAQNG